MIPHSVKHANEEEKKNYSHFPKCGNSEPPGLRLMAELSGLRSAMPITSITLPGLTSPLMHPQKELSVMGNAHWLTPESPRSCWNAWVAFLLTFYIPRSSGELISLILMVRASWDVFSTVLCSANSYEYCSQKAARTTVVFVCLIVEMLEFS